MGDDEYTGLECVHQAHDGVFGEVSPVGCYHDFGR
jgi:hypothetical protein